MRWSHPGLPTGYKRVSGTSLSASATRVNSSVPPDASPDSALWQWAEAEVEATFGRLPNALREKALRLPVTLESVPNAGLQADGIPRDTLGLFTGAEYIDEGHLPMPPQIILFLSNLWAFSGHEEQAFRQEVRTTLLHELGHYLGLDEDDLAERGLE
jgi:predicted Zn-dependent protease with MMP-like domain